MNGREIMEGAAAQIEATAYGPKPSVGRIVHYRDEYGRTVAAMVTEVISDDFVVLTLFPSGLMPIALTFGTHRGTAPGTWFWPERV